MISKGTAIRLSQNPFYRPSREQQEAIDTHVASDTDVTHKTEDVASKHPPLYPEHIEVGEIPRHDSSIPKHPTELPKKKRSSKRNR